MKMVWRFFALTIFAVALVACSSEPEAAKEAPPAPNMKASVPAAAPETGPAQASHSMQEIPLMGVAELDTYLKENVGKPTMVLLWATWCPSCKQQIPDLEQLAQTHGDKVNILAMSLDENRDALVSYLKKKPMGLPVVWGTQEIGKAHDVAAIPTLLIFDKSGKKIFGQPGVFPGSMLGAMADKLASE